MSFPSKIDYAALHHASSLKENGNYWLLKKKLEETVLALDASDHDLNLVAKSIFASEGGFGQVVENYAINLVHQENSTQNSRLSDTIRRVKNSLHELVTQRLKRYSIDVGISYFRKKNANEVYVQSLQEKSQLLSTASNDSKDAPTILCSTEELLELVHNILEEQRAENPCISLQEVKYSFRELHVMFQHFGLEELLQDTTDTSEMFEVQRITVGERILRSESLCAARQFARYGLPSSLRPQLWYLILSGKTLETDMQNVSRSYNYYNKLVQQYDFIIDRLLREDAKQCQEDDDYFVFEEMITQVLLLWSRKSYFDKSFLSHSLSQMENFDISWATKRIVYPIRGFSVYAMPISYLFEDYESAFSAFDLMFTNYFSKLSSISMAKDGLIELCRVFYSFLKEADPLLYYHFASTLRLSPLDIAFKWIVHGFIGILDAEQVLLLWDRIIGFDSLMLLPLSAASIFVFRRDLLLQCRNQNEVQACLEDLSHLKWLPLVQNLLDLCTY